MHGRVRRWLAAVALLALGAVGALATTAPAATVLTAAAPTAGTPTAAAPTAGTPTAATPARLAFLRGGDVWVADTNGSRARRIGPGEEDALISPDGRWVATYRQATTTYLEVYPVAGGRPVRLTPPPGLTWQSRLDGYSPDSRYLAAAAALGEKRVIELVDLKTRTVRKRLIGGFSGSWAPQSPDRFVWSQVNGPLAIYDVGTRRTKKLLTDARGPVWGPRTVAFSRSHQVWTVNVDGSHVREVTHVQGNPLRGGELTAVTPGVWSPDGQELTGYVSYLDGAQDYSGLVSMTSGRITPTLIDTVNVGPYAFNADGTRLLFGFGPSFPGPPAFAKDIITSSLSGTHVRVLAKDADAPSWTL